MNTLVYLETDGDRTEVLAEHIYQGHVYAVGHSAHSEWAYVVWTRMPSSTVNALSRLPWVSYVRSLHKGEREWDDTYANYLRGWRGWVEDTSYTGPPLTPGEQEATDLLAHAATVTIRARWDGRWSAVVLATAEAGEDGKAQAVPLAVLIPFEEAPKRLALTAGIGFVETEPGEEGEIRTRDDLKGSDET
jgi:hypothetical protein